MFLKLIFFPSGSMSSVFQWTLMDLLKHGKNLLEIQILFRYSVNLWYNGWNKQIIQHFLHYLWIQILFFILQSFQVWFFFYIYALADPKRLRLHLGYECSCSSSRNCKSSCFIPGWRKYNNTQTPQRKKKLRWIFTFGVKGPFDCNYLQNVECVVYVQQFKLNWLQKSNA